MLKTMQYKHGKYCIERMFCDRMKEKQGVRKVIEMPRKAREKHNEAIYHIMCRSESEFLLFRDNADKKYYLGLLKKNVDKYKCRIYAYCLMDSHLHIHLDPRGYDVSKFMHSINTSYVLYYNKKYNRHGHVFQERFQSRILDSDGYNLAVSAYIHNNPKDMEGYAGREEEYKYSSYGIYLGLRKDEYKLVDMSFIQSLIGINNRRKFAEKYYHILTGQREIRSLKEFNFELLEEVGNEYISGRKTIIREIAPSKVISYILNKLKVPAKSILASQRKQKLYEYRAFTAYVLRVLCGLGYKQICEAIYNITISGCSRLCNRGYELSNKDELLYGSIFDELMSCKSW